jgi:hypothetical protein
MIHRVPKQMEERIANFVEEGSVEFDVSPLDHEGHTFLQLPRQIPDRAGKSVEHFRHRGESGLGDAGLGLGHQATDAPRQRLQGGPRGGHGNFGELVGRHDQFTDLIEEIIQTLKGHSHLAPGHPRRGRGAIPHEDREHVTGLTDRLANPLV